MFVRLRLRTVHILFAIPSWYQLSNVFCISVTLPSDAASSMTDTDTKMFPNISTALKILCILPVVDFYDELSRDSLNRLKSFLKEREAFWFKPEPLALLYSHRYTDIDIDAVIETYKKKLKELDEGSIVKNKQSSV